MKKVLTVLITILTFTACNNNAETATPVKDTAAVCIDSTGCENCDSTVVDTTSVK